MALTPLEVLDKIVENRVAKAKLTGFRTLANLADRGRVRIARKSSIDWDVEVGGATAAWEAVTANSANTLTDDVVPANLRVGQYRLKHQFNISKVAIQEAAEVAPAELSDLFGAHTDRALNILFRTLNAALYVADGTSAYGGMVGMAKWADDTYSYAGVSPVTYPAWKALSLTNAGTGRALTRNLMLALDEQVNIQETMYDMVVMHPSQCTKYVQLFDTIGFNPNIVSQRTDSNRLPSVDLGHGGRFWNNYPIIEDPQAPLGIIHTLNTNDVDLYCFELANNPSNPGIGQHVVNKSYGIPIHIFELASQNSAVRTFEFSLYPQLRLFNRKSYQLIGDLT